MRNNTHSLSGIVTFLTDFGLKDGYSGVMKGVVLTHFPQAILVDITHEVPPFNLCAAALILESAFLSFPCGTTHIVVVDPGVGSSRRHLVTKAAGHTFIGPDNGILGRVAREFDGRVFEINPAQLGVEKISNTFHGRDIYALTAGKLLAGLEIQAFASPVNDPEVLELQEPREVQGEIEGEVIYIDHFGNLVTNIKEQHLVSGSKLIIGKQTILKASNYIELTPGIPGAILNSWGYYEIALREASAAERLDVKISEKVIVARTYPESSKKEKV